MSFYPKTPNPNRNSGWNQVEQHSWLAAILGLVLPYIEKAFPESIAKPVYELVLFVCVFIAAYWVFIVLLGWLSEVVGSKSAAIICALFVAIYVFSFSNVNGLPTQVLSKVDPRIIPTPDVSPSTNSDSNTLVLPTPSLNSKTSPETPKDFSFEQAGNLVLSYLEARKEFNATPYKEYSLNKLTEGKIKKDIKNHIKKSKEEGFSYSYEYPIFEPKKFKDKFFCDRGVCMFAVQIKTEYKKYSNKDFGSANELHTYKLHNNNGIWRIYDLETKPYSNNLH